PSRSAERIGNCRIGAERGTGGTGDLNLTGDQAALRQQDLMRTSDGNQPAARRADGDQKKPPALERFNPAGGWSGILQVDRDDRRRPRTEAMLFDRSGEGAR